MDVLGTPNRNHTANIQKLLTKTLQKFNDKIIVLDDDPTGTQTVHGISVYTDWSEKTIESIFKNDTKIVYILTNSRSFSVEKTVQIHQEIAIRIAKVSQKLGLSFVIISRGDSTLRGHYPIETETLKRSLESTLPIKIDGEIICPAFFEGERYTIDDVHYLKEKAELIPVGETEFAKDQTFGFQSSNLQEYIKEKSGNKDVSIISIKLEELKYENIDAIQEKLERVQKFQKIIVNAENYDQLKIFAIALIRTMTTGKKFLFRTAASFPKVLGDITDQPYLNRNDIVKRTSQTGGLIVIGSHVKLTTSQLNELRRTAFSLQYVEFHVDAYFQTHSFKQEIERVFSQVEEYIRSGISVVLYTSRKLLLSDDVDKEKILEMSVSVSDALTKIVAKLEVAPKYIIAKGGITSSDVATKGLNITKAEVLGQIDSGIPVWRTDNESKFPAMPYLIFPGNVGTKTTLRKIVEMLEG